LIRIAELAVASYVIGSLPIARLVPNARQAGVLPAWIRGALIGADILKGVLAVSLVGSSANPYAQSLAATAVVAGQLWPLWTSPRDERGLAVAAGALTLVTPIAAPAWVVVWAIGYVASGYLPVGTAAATVLLPVVIGYVAGWPFGLVVLPVSLLILERHRDVLKRILAGREEKHYWRGGA
jgi:glycerol-3-phosphate acyltransferase PlsY